MRAEGAAHRHPILPGQEPVEHDHVVLVHGGLLLALLAGDRHIDDEAFLLKPPGEEPGGLTIVLHQQNSHRGPILPPVRSAGENLKKNSGALQGIFRQGPVDCHP